MTSGFNGAAPAKRFLDIEKALRWAFRDELPKRGHRGGAWANVDYPSSSCMSEAASDHGAPDGPTREPGFPAAAGDPHPDSLTIETAVQGLAGWAGHQFGADEMAALTCGIPIPQDGLGTANFDPAAIGIEAIACMPGTVTINARMGTRPKWTAERPRPRWINGPNGKPKVLIDQPIVFRRPPRDPFGRELVEMATFPCPPSHKDVYRAGAYCPLLWRPDPARLVAERAEHSAWRAGLEILAGALAGQLMALAVLEPAATWAPWLSRAELVTMQRQFAEHGAPPPHLFAGLREPPYRRQTREQAAAQRRTAQRRTLQEAGDITGGPAGNGGRRVRPTRGWA
jgi:hypothetical protein